jgi:heme/copper-type cytochrome/quinol oxidase subunit 1
MKRKRNSDKKDSQKVNIQSENQDVNRYPLNPPPMPEYQISPGLRKLTLFFIGAFFINFLIAGVLAMGMRFIQTDIPLPSVDTIAQNQLFYTFLTAHGQVMFFGVASEFTMFFGYYAVSKWGRKPLRGIKWAWASFWSMEGAVILIFISTIFGFGAGWYNLMPLTFLSGRAADAWGTEAAAVFLVGDVLVGVALTIWCVVIIATLLKGKLPTGTEKLEKEREEVEEEKEKTRTQGKFTTKYRDHTKLAELPAAVRWVALLGINGWFPKKWREQTPAVPIILVAAFVTAVVQLTGNPGLFLQLAHGFTAIHDPVAASNWLLTKDAWWFFAHPIVYYVLLLGIGATYEFIPRYARQEYTISKWNYRPWPFYFTFSILVFAHHMFMDMPNPVWLQMLSQTASLGIVFPSGLTIGTVLMHIWRSNVSWNITSRFLLAGLAGWAFGGYQGTETGMWGADIYQHNTMALPGHIHLIVLMGPVVMGFGVIYAIIPDLTKKHMDKTLSEIHFWLTTFGGFGFAILFTVIGMEGAIRREADMQAAFQWAMPWLLFFALSIGIGQIFFAYNFIKTLKRKITPEEERVYEKVQQFQKEGPRA